MAHKIKTKESEKLEKYNQFASNFRQSQIMTVECIILRTLGTVPKILGEISYESEILRELIVCKL